MRPARSRSTPGVPNPSHFGGTPRSSWPFSSTSPNIHYLLLWAGAEVVGAVPELAVLYTRPCGVPLVGREPEKRRFAPLPQRALATASSAAPPTPIQDATDSQRVRW